MQVKALGADQFVFNTISSPPTAGMPFTITITAEVPVFPGSPDTTYSGTPTLSVSTGTISPTITPAFLNGVWTGPVSVTGAGSSVTITATDGADSGTSNSFKVNPGVLNHFTLSTPGSVTAGSSFGSVTVTAYDTNGNVKTDYTGSIYFTSSDSAATLPYISSSKYTFVSGDNGAHTFSGFILKTIPSQTIAVTDGSISTSSSSIIVNDAGISKFAFGAISTQTAGVAFNVGITAQDAYGNTVTSYTGNPSLTYSAGTINPASSGAFVSGTKTVSVTVTAAGTGVTITANDASITGTSSGFTVNIGVASQLVYTAGTAQSLTAGVVSPTAIVVQRQDQYGNPVSIGTSAITVTLSTTSSGGVFSNSGGTTITSISIAAGSSSSAGFYYKDTVTASPTLTGAYSGLTSATTQFTINAAGISKFAFAAIGTQTAGTAFSITITAQDTYGNIVTAYSGNPALTCSAGAGSINPTSSGGFVSGTKTVSVTVTQAGSFTITATDGSTTGTSTAFTVNPAGLDHFVFSTIGTQTVGTGFSITITAKDASENTVTSYTGTNALTVSSGTISPTGTTAFTAGVWTGSVTLTQTGTGITISTTGGGKSGTSSSFTVSPGVLDHFAFNTISSPQAAGTAFSVTITAKDLGGNTVSSYTGTNALTVSSGTINPTSTAAFVSGVWTGQVTLPQSGTGISISTSGGGKSGTSNSFNVNAGVATTLAVSSGTSQVAGTPFSITVTAKDANGNTATGYTGTVHFSTSDSGVSVSLPSNYAFQSGDLGTHTFTDGVKLMTVGTQSVTATDTAAGSITGFQAGITVKVSSGIHFVVTGFPNPATAGSAGTVTVTVKDQYGNLFSGYAGTVKITSSDSSAVLPANAPLTNGVGSFAVTLKTAGSQSITATDTATSTINGLQTGITVNHAAVAVNVAISPSGSSVTSGASKTFSAMASDAYGNSWDVTALTSWSISSGAGGSWSSSVFTSAAVGSWTVTGTYASTAYTTGLTVNSASLDHFVFSFVGDQGAGSAFSVTVMARDKYENNVTDYIGTPSLTVSAGSISPGIMNAFVNGVGSTLVTVNTAGSAVSITAADGSVSGVSNSFTVSNSPTPTPTQAPNSTPTPTSNPKNTPTPTPTPTPSLSPTPLATVPAKTDSGSIVELAIKGNITTSQISNATITSNQSTTTTTLSFTITGPNASTGFSNMTIPKTAIPYGTTPLIYIDGQQAANQGYAQDANNFYVWYTTHFSTHQVKVQFAGSSTLQAISFGSVLAVGVTVPEIILIYALIAIRRLKRKPENA
jgi:hypothetical protein